MRLGAEQPEARFISVFKAEGGGNCSSTKASSWLLAKWVCSLISGARRQLLHFFLSYFHFCGFWQKKKLTFFSFFLFPLWDSGIRRRASVTGGVWQAGHGGLMDSSWQKIPAGNEILKFWTLQVLIFEQIRLMKDESIKTETLDRTCGPLLTF